MKIMKILEICGSPRIKGNTEHIMELCEHQINNICKPGDKIVYDKIFIYNCNLGWCKGCRVCFNISEEKCPHTDELLIIKRKMEEADIIIIGSPVYLEDISGGLKNWMDRMAFNCHRPFLNGKPIYVYSTSAAFASSHAIKSMKRAIIAWGGNVIKGNNFLMGELMKYEDAEKKYGLIIKRKMQGLIEAYKKNSVSLYSLIGFGIQKRYWKKKEHTADYNYWMQMKWFDADSIYYHNIKGNFLKKKLAIILSGFIETFIM